MTLPIKDLIIQQLLEFDPTFDVGGGVATTTLMIEPLSVVLQPIANELSLLQKSMSILSILELDDPDAFPEDIVDGLASNVFIERNTGEIATTTQRINFFEAQNFSSEAGILTFRGSGGQRYVNAESFSISEAEMSLNTDGGVVYVDIQIVSTDNGSMFNVAAGDITVMDAEPVGISSTTNLFKIEDGRDRETNTELIDRIKVAVTVRALVTGRGIIVTLTENFTTIVEIQPIGFGDPEMMRDIVYNTHIGGNVDVYIRTASVSDGEDDFFGLQVDTTRRATASSVVALLVQGSSYSLGRRSIDSSSVSPVVKSIDGSITFVETFHYTIDYTLGEITRTALSTIFHISSATGEAGPNPANDVRRFKDVGAFGSVRAGMILTISSPASVAGTYTIKNAIGIDDIEIYGGFSANSYPVTGITYAIDDNLTVAFEYNPISIDIIKQSRSSDRDLFTIVNVPLMRTVQMAVLDPISGDPTGELLDNAGGFGAGKFGVGGFGVGGGADFQLVVTEPTLRFSDKEDNFLNFQLKFLGYSVRVSYEWASAIAAIQAYVDDEQNRTVAADLLARHFNPAYVDSVTPIEYQIKASTEPTAIAVSDMQVLVETFIDGLSGSEDFEASDVVDILYDNGAVRVDLDTVLDMRATLHHQDGSSEFILMDRAGVMTMLNGTIPDPTDKPISNRVGRFLSGTISLERTVV